MRLIIPLTFFTAGGVERVILSICTEVVHYVEEIILILPQKMIGYFQSELAGVKITYETIEWEPKSLTQFYLLITEQFSSRLNSKKLEHFPLGNLQNRIKKHRSFVKYQLRLKHLARKHQATHALYFLTNRLPLPQLDIPVGMVCNDIFWQSSPLSYSENYKKEYDRSLISWLDYCSKVISISETTKRDILKIAPLSKDKISVVLCSGYRAKKTIANNFDSLEQQISRSVDSEINLSFYFPSSFSIYKDHLSLLEAVVTLLHQNSNFKVILTGKDTDKLAIGDFNLAFQTQTKEYEIYLEQLRDLYRKEPQAFLQHLIGLGYCEETMVEACYAVCNCVVIPSRYEGFGLALSEAIVRGLPVICSDLDVFQEQIELYRCNDRVFTFSSGDSSALMVAMKQFLENPIPKLTPLEIEERFSHWKWSDVAQRYVQVLLS